MAIIQFPGTDFHDLNLDWILSQVKNLLAEWAETKGEWENLVESNEDFVATVTSEWDDFEEYVTNYLATLPLTEEVSAKIDAMVEDGTLLELITHDEGDGSALSDVAGQWLSAHITQETGYVIDDSLTVQGAAADAKATGIAIGKIADAVEDMQRILYNDDSLVVDNLASSFYTSLPITTYKWIIGIIPAGSVVNRLQLVVQGNSTSIVKLEKWVYSESDNGYVYDSMVEASSVEAYENASECYILTFDGFSVTDKTLLSFSDTSSNGWVRFVQSQSGVLYKFTNNLTVVSDANIQKQTGAYMLYYLDYTKLTEKKRPVIVNPDGTGDYTNIIDAMTNTPEETPIYIMPGVYEQDMTTCLKKRVILIGADRNQCIIKDTDGRYNHHPLYLSCGYLENLTVESVYVSGTSHEIGSDSGSYALHIDADEDYAVGKQLEIHHCTLRSDFFPAIGCGLRKDMTVIIDDCILENNQVAGRGNYSNSGSLGALYFHDSNGEQGNQYIIVKDCVLKSNLQYAMCPYKVIRETQENHVYCDFINNVLFSNVGGYTNTIWFRNDPFNENTGIFSIVIGYGNSIDSINNN